MLVIKGNNISNYGLDKISLIIYFCLSKRGYIMTPEELMENMGGKDEKQKYIDSVHKRIEEFSASYIIDPEGNKKYPSGYSPENDVDRQKFIYFFRSINYDKEIVEQILLPSANSIRAAILEAPLYDLMIKSKNGS